MTRDADEDEIVSPRQTEKDSVSSTKLFPVRQTSVVLALLAREAIAMRRRLVNPLFTAGVSMSR